MDLFQRPARRGKPMVVLEIIRDSSAVEQEAVNFEVAGSNPVPGANFDF